MASSISQIMFLGAIKKEFSLEWSTQKIVNVHPTFLCEGQPCTVHNRTQHHMRGWKQNFRQDNGGMERICPWGVGHLDPDSPGYQKRSLAVHGCIMNPHNPSVAICEPWKLGEDDAAWITQTVFVTKDGRVWEFLPMPGGEINYIYPIEMEPVADQDGELFVSTYDKKTLEKGYVKSLVYAAWNGEYPQLSYSIVNIDGDPTNNRLENLALKKNEP